MGDPSSVYLHVGRHWRHSCDKMDQAFPLRFCILQAIKNWTVGRPGNEATTEAHTDQHTSMLCMVHCILYGGEYPLFATSLKKTRPLQDVTISLCRREKTTPWYVQLYMTPSITKSYQEFFAFFAPRLFLIFCRGTGESQQLGTSVFLVLHTQFSLWLSYICSLVPMLRDKIWEWPGDEATTSVVYFS